MSDLNIDIVAGLRASNDNDESSFDFRDAITLVTEGID
jgi:hypothetical protein